MENNSTKSNVETEIDLWDILQKFGSWCSKVILALLTFLLRKSVWLICFCFAGVAVGGVLYTISKPNYSAQMLVQINVADNFFYVNLINENLAARSITGPRDLARKLGVAEDMAKQIKNIQAYHGVDFNSDGVSDAMDEKNEYVASRDSTKASKVLHHVFYVRTLASSQEVLPHIRKSVIDFIHKNDFVQRHNTRRIEEINEQISYLHLQIKRLDSLQQYEYFLKGNTKKNAGAGQFLVLNEQAQSLYHNDLISLNNQVLDKNTVLRLYSEPIAVVQDFAEVSRRKNGLMFYVKPLALSFFLIGLLLLIIWDYRKPLVRLYRERTA
ncbi:MAG: hypothetical protein LBT94_06665 [Prevotellaceae bacterium]|jgi:hypothetical protein|nr:hypothetical protein [Prevotellaceae bacterium]